MSFLRDFTPEELTDAAGRTKIARSYAAGRLRGFQDLNLRQLRHAQAFIEGECLKQLRRGLDPHVATEAITKAVEAIGPDNGVAFDPLKKVRGPIEIKPIHIQSPETLRRVEEAKRNQ